MTGRPGTPPQTRHGAKDLCGLNKGSPRRAAHYPRGGFVSLAIRAFRFGAAMCGGRSPVSSPARCLHRSNRPGFPGPSAASSDLTAVAASAKLGTAPPSGVRSRPPPALRLRLVPSPGLPPCRASSPPPAASASDPFGSVPSVADNHVNTFVTEAQWKTRLTGPGFPENRRKTPQKARFGPKSHPRYAPLAPPRPLFHLPCGIRHPRHTPVCCE